MRLLVLDPGGTCGILYTAPHLRVGVVTGTCSADELPAVLYHRLGHTLWGDCTLVYESYHLRPGKAKAQTGSSMPAPEGIGVLRGVAHALGMAPPVAVPPSCKTAGRAYAEAWLPNVAAARARATNDHERDVCDLAGYVLRQHALGKAPFA